jgi:uncharacterized repeat protein (TIGR04076 family)
MAFKVRVRVVGFLGNEELYPCHMKHKVGDEVIFDGESYTGRLCPNLWPVITPKVEALWLAGPKYRQPISQHPFWYGALSVPDDTGKKSDGVGWKNVFEPVVPGKYDMAQLQPPNTFLWPPNEQGDSAAEVTVVCPDTRTSMLLKLEAFDLSEKGYDTPYYRRAMAILAKLLKHGPAQSGSLLDMFTREEIEDIYPPLGTVMVRMLTEELEQMRYVATADGTVSVTPSGEAKLATFKADLPAEDREFFEKYVQ